MNKLEAYGVTGKFKALITSYLTNRYQKVTLGNIWEMGKSSNWKLITTGVPQDSVLGPLLFFVYINDMPSIINKNAQMILFADDINIHITDSNRENFLDNIKQMFQTVNTWFVNNRLSLNINKTQLVEFKSSNYANDSLLTTDDISGIKQTDETRFLGITLDRSLAWKQQIDQMVAKMSSACYALRNIKYVVSQDILRMVYFANIHSILSYVIVLWGNSEYTKKYLLYRIKY
jgi:hypothetical protein